MQDQTQIRRQNVFILILHFQFTCQRRKSTQ